MTALAIVLAALAALYAAWRIRFRYPPSTPQVLCFHKVSSRFCWEGTWTTPSRFFAYVDRLTSRGYRFIGEDEYLDAIATGAPGDKRVFLTFDDGYRGIRVHAFDGLRARGIPFHVFLLPEFVGRTNEWDLSLGRRPAEHLTWDDVREMSAAGVTFGSHGATHRDLTRVPADELERELSASKRSIEDNAGVTVRTFSYPFGRYDDAARAAARAAGYDAAFSLYPPHSNQEVDRFALRRNGVYIIDPVRTIHWKLRPGPFYWFEEMKCRTINAVAVLTPLLKR